MLSENARIVYDYVKAHNGENFTAADIADATGLPKKTVDGVVTMAFQKKKLMQRTPAQIQLDDGTTKEIKFISFTEAGLVFNPDEAE